MTNRHDLLEQIAGIIGDYRKGQIPPCDENHVDRWVNQFTASDRQFVLSETAHILERCYVTQEMIADYYRATINQKDFATFFKNANFLRIQTDGGSQRDLLNLFDTVLEDECGFTLADCGSDDGWFVYLDDAIFSGGRLTNDIRKWIAGDMPKQASLLVFLYAEHQSASYSQKRYLVDEAKKAGKSLVVQFISSIEIENRLTYRANADILWPTEAVLSDPEIENYAQTLPLSYTYRDGNNVGKRGLFSSGTNRDLIERHYIKGGFNVLEQCKYLAEKSHMKPLGASLFPGFGFGALFVTYRNCPNNAPLIWWAGNPWHPLFPRITN